MSLWTLCRFLDLAPLPLLGCDRSLILKPDCWLLDVTIHNPGKSISPKLRFLAKFVTQASLALPRPRSTPMAAQAPELLVGCEPMSQRWSSHSVPSVNCSALSSGSRGRECDIY
eukprot:COSAG01_NODE_1182_length_11347_cov_7.504356_4_plen_114_part_00